MATVVGLASSYYSTYVVALGEASERLLLQSDYNTYCTADLLYLASWLELS